jgi:hypothetical protein
MPGVGTVITPNMRRSDLKRQPIRAPHHIGNQMAATTPGDGDAKSPPMPYVGGFFFEWMALEKSGTQIQPIGHHCEQGNSQSDAGKNNDQTKRSGAYVGTGHA